MEPRLIGRDKIAAEINLRQATKNTYKSVGIVTAYINKCIQNYTEDPEYFEIVKDVEDVCTSLDCGKGILEQRVSDMVSLQLFCAKKVIHWENM